MCGDLRVHNDFSRRIWIYFLKHKSEVFQKFKKWKTMTENQKRRKAKVKVLRSDNGSDYISAEFKTYLTGEGIEHQLSIPERSEQNGVTEGMNRTLTQCAHNMRLQADMSEEFWAETMSHACYLVNRSPSTVVYLQIPEEIWREESGLFNLTDFWLLDV